MFVFVAPADFLAQQQSAGLGDAFHRQNSRHNRKINKMPGKIIILGRSLFIAHDRVAFNFFNLVHPQKRLFVRNNPFYLFFVVKHIEITFRNRTFGARLRNLLISIVPITGSDS